MTRLLINLTRGYFRKHRLEALLCLVGVALGVAVVIAIDSAVAACVRSFQGAVSTLAERSTHSIFDEQGGTIPDDTYIALANTTATPLAPLIDRGVLIARATGADPAVARLIGVDVFSERALRSFTNMKSSLDDTAFRQFLTRPDQVVLVDALATRLNAKPGDTVQLTIGARRIPVTVTGVVKPAGVARSQLGDLIITDLATAQELTESLGRIDRIDVNLPDPAAEERLTAALPKDLVLRSTQQQSTSLSDLIASYKLNLNSLSLMASFVAVFIVYNSMLVSVQQRVTTLGILRCLGASRPQIVTLYLLEAAAFAIAGGLIGVVGGWGLSKLLVGYVSTTINDLYAAVRPGPVPLDAATFIKGLAISAGSCLVGALVPLYRASRTPPVNTFRVTAQAHASGRASRYLLVLGLALLGVTAAIYYLPGRSPVVGFVMALLLALGFAFCCPFVTRALCAAVGRLVRPTQLLPVQLAAAGVGRSLGITGVAVAAMMLAMAMNVGVRTMVTSFRGSLASWMERRFSADVFIGPELTVHHKIEATLDPRVEEWVRRQPETDRIVHYRAITAPIANKPTLVVGTDVQHLLASNFPVKTTESNRPYNSQTDALISEPLAGRTNWRPGQTITVDTPTGPRELHVHAVFYDFGNERGQLLLDRQTYAAAWNDPRVTSIHVTLKPGHDGNAIAPKWSAILRKDYPVVSNSFLGVKTEVLAVFDRTFAVTDVLSWLAGGVAFCGLAGSLLALSLARRRDYSLLAAVGMSARQTTAWVLTQGLLIAVTSAAVAALAGTLLAYILSYVIQYRSFGWSIPTTPQPQFWLQSLLLATAAAVVATLYPVYRLQKIPPADALRQE